MTTRAVIAPPRSCGDRFCGSCPISKASSSIRQTSRSAGAVSLRGSFPVRASRAVEGQQVRGQLSVFYDAVLIADISLSIRVDGAVAAPIHADAERGEAAQARPYRKIFISYSHRDLAVVEQVATIEHLIGDEFVRDWTQLRAGEDWDTRLLELIAEADVFQLFWSRNSMYSPNVRREWDYALSLQRPSFVRPVYWEDPLPVDEDLPPDALRRLHFQRVDFPSHPALRAAPPAEHAPGIPGDDSPSKSRTVSSSEKLGPARPPPPISQAPSAPSARRLAEEAPVTRSDRGDRHRRPRRGGGIRRPHALHHRQRDF